MSHFEDSIPNMRQWDDLRRRWNSTTMLLNSVKFCLIEAILLLEFCFQLLAGARWVSPLVNWIWMLATKRYCIDIVNNMGVLSTKALSEYHYISKYRHRVKEGNKGPAKKTGCTRHLASKPEIITGQFWYLLAKILIIKSCHQNS